MSSSDSSEDENVDRLREAADSQFLNDSMYGSNAVNGSAVIGKKRPSLRPSKEEDHQNALRVTPEFQSFVAKQLSNLLDSQLKEVTRKLKTRENGNNCEELFGVRLLASSTSFVSCKEEPTIQRKKPIQKIKKRKLVDGDESDDGSSAEERRLSEAAISADWILSQAATRGWEKNMKGKVIVVKSSEIEIREAERGVGKKKKKKKKKLEDVGTITKTDVNGSEEKEEAKRAKKREKRRRCRERLKRQKEMEEDGTQETEVIKKKKRKKNQKEGTTDISESSGIVNCSEKKKQRQS